MKCAYPAPIPAQLVTLLATAFNVKPATLYSAHLRIALKLLLIWGILFPRVTWYTSARADAQSAQHKAVILALRAFINLEASACLAQLHLNARHVLMVQHAPDATKGFTFQAPLPACVVPPTVRPVLNPPAPAASVDIMPMEILVNPAVRKGAPAAKVISALHARKDSL